MKNHRRLSRREFLRRPPALGLSALALGAGFGIGSPRALSPVALALPAEDDVPVRRGLGIVIVGGSSGLGAEMARQYAAHGAYIVLAARRQDRLAEVAADVNARGGTAHVVPTDVRNDAACVQLVPSAIDWLATHGKAIDLLVLGAFRSHEGQQEHGVLLLRNLLRLSSGREGSPPTTTAWLRLRVARRRQPDRTRAGWVSSPAPGASTPGTN
jgi:hypothetical protein